MMNDRAQFDKVLSLMRDTTREEIQQPRPPARLAHHQETAAQQTGQHRLGHHRRQCARDHRVDRSAARAQRLGGGVGGHVVATGDGMGLHGNASASRIVGAPLSG